MSWIWSEGRSMALDLWNGVFLTIMIFCPPKSYFWGSRNLTELYAIEGGGGPLQEREMRVFSAGTFLLTQDICDQVSFYIYSDLFLVYCFLCILKIMTLFKEIILHRRYWITVLTPAVFNASLWQVEWNY